MLGAMVPLRSRSAASAPDASASTSISISISISSPPDASASTSSSAPATASAAPLATVSQLRRCRSHPAHDPALPPHQLLHCDARTTTTATWSGAATVWRGDGLARRRRAALELSVIGRRSAAAMIGHREMCATGVGTLECLSFFISPLQHVWPCLAASAATAVSQFRLYAVCDC